MIKKMFLKSEFAKSVLTLMTGTTIAQAIPLLVAPLLTRMYNPDDFGLFGIFAALFSIFSVVVTLRYAYSIVLPRLDKDATCLLILSSILSLAVSMLLLIIVYVFNAQISEFLESDDLGDMLYLLPIALACFGIFQSFNFWNIRKKNYSVVASTKISQTSSMSLAQLGFGFANFTSVGLILGYMLGQFVSAMSIFGITYSRNRQMLLGSSWPRILANSRKYIDYPKYTAFPSVLGSFTLQAPIFFITKAYDLVTVGFIALTLRVLAAPAGIISTSIGQVYLQKIASIANENPAALGAEVVRTAKKLLIISMLIFAPVLFFGEEIFALIFGDEWAIAGRYAQILSMPLAVRFFVSPLSTMFGVTNNTKIGAYWKYSYCAVTVVVLFVFSKYEFERFLKVYAASDIVMYLLHLGLIFYAARNYKKRQKKSQNKL